MNFGRFGPRFTSHPGIIHTYILQRSGQYGVKFGGLAVKLPPQKENRTLMEGSWMYFYMIGWLLFWIFPTFPSPETMKLAGLLSSKLFTCLGSKTKWEDLTQLEVSYHGVTPKSSIYRWIFQYKPPILGYTHLWTPPSDCCKLVRGTDVFAAVAFCRLVGRDAWTRYQAELVHFWPTK